MKRFLFFPILFLAILLSGAGDVLPQSSHGVPANAKKANKRKASETPKPTPPPDEGDVVESDGEITIDTTLVTIPVKVVDRSGRFVPNLKKEDFRIQEDKEDQEIAYFSNEQMPFTVALVLDMSYSSVFKINEIQQAALQFVTELRPKDKVLVVAFYDQVEVLSEITSDRDKINRAILQTRIGSGTSVYEAVDTVLNKRLERVEGRKAVVLFTDGVDTTSRRVTERNNLRDALESEVIFYPIRYDTYADVQAMQQGRVVINDPSRPRTTPPIGGGTIPGSATRLPLPIPTGTIGGSRRRSDPRSRRTDPARDLPDGSRAPSPPVIRDGTTREEYKLAEKYLDQMASRTGGRVFQAFDNTSLAGAFSRIAAELREFYSLGYYPSDTDENSRRRRIKVKVNKKKVSVRARETYILRPVDK